MASRHAFIVFSLATLAHCGSESTPPPEYPPLEPSQTAGLENSKTTASTTIAATAAPKPQVSVAAAEHTPIEGAQPSLRIAAPAKNAIIRADTVTVRLVVNQWPLSATGNHVHLIVDNHPYIALRDVSKPIDLGRLMQDELGVELTEGTHVLRSFPSRGHHESVKQGQPFAWTMFHFKKKTDGLQIDSKAPLLTYSRPKGCNKAGEPVLLDFYISNIDALSADGYQVQYTIDNDITGKITEWKPHYIHNLDAGEHSIRLQLLSKEGAPEPGPFNDTTRSIEVADTCK